MSRKSCADRRKQIPQSDDEIEFSAVDVPQLSVPDPTRTPDEQRPLLLIVDDDAVAATVLGSLLRGDGYDVEVQSSSSAAIRRLSRAPLPDGMITDLHMPGPNGIEVSRQAQAQRTLLPIFIVTGDPRALSPTTLSPCVEVLCKPIDYEKLVRRLHVVIPVRA